MGREDRLVTYRRGCLDGNSVMTKRDERWSWASISEHRIGQGKGEESVFGSFRWPSAFLQHPFSLQSWGNLKRARQGIWVFAGIAEFHNLYFCYFHMISRPLMSHANGFLASVLFCCCGREEREPESVFPFMSSLISCMYVCILIRTTNIHK